MVFDSTILRKYARLTSPEELPHDTYFMHTDDTVTILDKYPKAIYHVLLLPRIHGKIYTASNLTSLKTLLNSPSVGREDAVSLLQLLKRDKEKVIQKIEEEMMSKFGHTWGIYAGFHANPTMDHMHLHIISDDFCGSGLKKKKHYNSFHPRLGFFLHLDEVLSWFDDGVAESYTKSKIKLNEVEYDAMLKEPLACVHCKRELKNMPTLRAHLKEHVEQRCKTHQKRKVEEIEDVKEPVQDVKQRRSEFDQTNEPTMPNSTEGPPQNEEHQEKKQKKV